NHPESVAESTGIDCRSHTHSLSVRHAAVIRVFRVLCNHITVLNPDESDGKIRRFPRKAVPSGHHKSRIRFVNNRLRVFVRLTVKARDETIWKYAVSVYCSLVLHTPKVDWRLCHKLRLVQADGCSWPDKSSADLLVYISNVVNRPDMTGDRITVSLPDVIHLY